MRKRSLVLLGLLAGLLFVLSVGGIYASVSKEISVTNPVDTGVVDIELTEYQLDENGDLKPWEDNPIILPGDQISKIPRITNVGYDCYVRAKLTMSIDELANAYSGFGEGWIEGSDGYYYYTEILEHGSYTDIFQGIQVPEDFPQDLEGQEVTLTIDVDSIQSKNFVPMFAEEHPWGSVEIQECLHEGPYTINQVAVAKPNEMGIVYEGASKELVKNSEDFFMNFITLMPGDVVSDRAELRNDSSNAMKLYFRTESKQTDLLSKIQLKLVLHKGSEQKVIYEGPLASEALSERMLLTQIGAKESESLEFTISVPEELQNAYTLLHDEVKWYFLTEEIPSSVKTGDQNDVVFFASLAGLVISGMMIFVLVERKKEERG